MSFLLDVNVVIALIDPTHVFHHEVHDWFEDEGRNAFATCPIVENGVLRILGHPSYKNGVLSPAEAAPSLASLRELPGCSFWSDDLSLFDATLVDLSKVRTSGQVTDTYLLALAVRNGGRLATLDRKLAASAVIGGPDALRLIPTLR